MASNVSANTFCKIWKNVLQLKRNIDPSPKGGDRSMQIEGIVKHQDEVIARLSEENELFKSKLMSKINT